MTDENRPEANEEESIDATETEVEDPIGDETDGEAMRRKQRFRLRKTPPML